MFVLWNHLLMAANWGVPSLGQPGPPINPCHKHFSCAKFICLMVESACWLISNCWTTRPGPIPNRMIIMFLLSVVTSSIPTILYPNLYCFNPRRPATKRWWPNPPEVPPSGLRRASPRGVVYHCVSDLLPFGPPFVPTKQKCALPCFSP